MAIDFQAFQKHLGEFDFNALFVDVLGWSHPTRNARVWRDDDAKGTTFRTRMVAELASVAVFEIIAEGGWPDEATRMAIWRHISQSHFENLLIFLDRETNPTQSVWYWVKRIKDEAGKKKNLPRRHEYFRGQPADLFASKLQAMVVELSELDEEGRIQVLEVARRMEAALDVEKTTKRFFTAYQQQHLALIDLIEGIADERDRRWYASVLLNRLMFVWFMQKKRFIDNGDTDYLSRHLKQSPQRGNDKFFSGFLNALFFEAFAKPEADRSDAARALTGKVPYLNGGLFLHHKLELDANDQPRIGITLNIPDIAFEGIFKLFAGFSWNLDDTPGGQADEINPDVLGYIFEKYINQKAFGAYYTRPEITSYLADRSIHQLILERVREPAFFEQPAVEFDSIADMLVRMDARIAMRLVNEVLPAITILDPAVGSGAFLVAALKTLINVYYAIVGRAKLGASEALQRWLEDIERQHASVHYFIKRKIVTDNLYGVDIMEEACEIAKLRLFLAMIASVRKAEDLEPLPNIDFNILPGNSLVGLMRVDEHEFNDHQPDMFKTPYRQLVEEKNRKLAVYRDTAGVFGKDVNLRELRDDIDDAMTSAETVMNELLRDKFEALGVKFEQATWDDKKKTLGKPVKRRITREDIDAQTPFHWGYVFDRIVQTNGGFDIILANPPWDVLKPQAKEFFANHSTLVSKNKMTIKEFEKEQTSLLKDVEVREAWLAYENRFPHMSSFFRAAPEYSHQSAVVGGKKTGSDINLYKLFTERCFQLARPGGHIGIVIPSGIYTDLGAKGLRDLLFNEAKIEGLFCFENRKEIFEGVHRSFKFVVLTFERPLAPRLQATGERNASAPPDDLLAPLRAGELTTRKFPAAFMRHDVAELARFPDEGALWLDVELIRKLSPDSHSVMEFKGELDIHIAKKMLKFPLLGEQIEGAWNLKLTNEFHMTNDSQLFKTAPGPGRLPLYEGKMIHQFDSAYAEPRYWVDAKEADVELRRGATRKLKQLLKAETGLSIEELDQLIDVTAIRIDNSAYRLGFRDIAASTNERAMICSLLPPGVFAGNTLNLLQPFEFETRDMKWQQRATLSESEQLFLCGVFNGFVTDWLLRQKITSHLNMFYVFQVPIPRLAAADRRTLQVAERTAKLICTTPEFDALARQVGLRDHRDGVTDPAQRAQLRAELDGLVAHLYGLTEDEFVHILATFPLVAEPVKVAARNAYRDVKRGLIK